MAKRKSPNKNQLQNVWQSTFQLKIIRTNIYQTVEVSQSPLMPISGPPHTKTSYKRQEVLVIIVVLELPKIKIF